MELGTRAQAPNGKSFRVKIEAGYAYVAWGGWTKVGKASSGGEAITQAEAFLSQKEPKK